MLLRSEVSISRVRQPLASLAVQGGNHSKIAPLASDSTDQYYVEGTNALKLRARLGPILYTMELAVILAGGLRDWIDFGVIIAILLLNAFVGWYQEKQAGDVVAKLKADIALKADVVRNGKEIKVEARDVVPGDIIVIEVSLLTV